MSEWHKLPVYPFSSSKRAFLWLGAAFKSRAACIGNFASICGVCSRAAFNRINTVTLRWTTIPSKEKIGILLNRERKLSFSNFAVFETSARLSQLAHFLKPLNYRRLMGSEATIISRVQMGSESVITLSNNSEAMRARGIIVLVKSN